MFASTQVVALLAGGAVARRQGQRVGELELLLRADVSTSAKRVFTGSAPSVPVSSTTGLSVSA